MALFTLGRKSLPTGSVLQVSDMLTITTNQSINTTSRTDLTGFSINITPTSTSSKIFIYTNIGAKWTGSNRGYGINIMRDSTEIFVQPQNYAQYFNTNDVRIKTAHTFIDSPQSISQITYKIQARSYLGEIRFNDDMTSQYYLMEIQG